MRRIMQRLYDWYFACLENPILTFMNEIGAYTYTKRRLQTIREVSRRQDERMYESMHRTYNRVSSRARHESKLSIVS